MGAVATMFEDIYGQNCLATEIPSITYSLPLSYEDAIDLVVKEVVKTNDYYVYSPADSLPPQEMIVSSIRPNGDYNRTLETNTWFFFVDTEPLAPFAHQTYFVFVNSETAEYIVSNESFYPIINGISYFSTLEERMDKIWRIYPDGGNLTYEDFDSGATESESTNFSFKLRSPGYAIAELPFGTPVPFDKARCCEGVGDRYALVITGYDEPMFRGDTELVYGYLKGQGFSDADITYLTASSGDSQNSDGKTALSTVNNAFQNLAVQAECCDGVFIYISGHGISIQMREWENIATGQKIGVPVGQLPGPDMANWIATGNTKDSHRVTINPEYTTPRGPWGIFGTNKFGSSRGGRMFDDEFAALLDNIDSCDLTFMYFSCFSGAASANLRGNGRTIITPVGGGNPAWGFPGAWGSWQAGSIFTQYFINAKTDAAIQNAVDTDGDGQVSDQEAFNHARTQTTNYVNTNINGAVQVGTWTAPLDCDCCHVECNDARNCVVVEGDGIDSPSCMFVGDYCGAGPSCGNGHINTGEECEEDSDCDLDEVCVNCVCIVRDIVIEPGCGDGIINGLEECEEDSDCSVGSCIECVCVSDVIQYCGDGIIIAPEECDGGSVATNVCPDGSICTDCSCIPIDVTPPPTHSECVSGLCMIVSGTGPDQCTADADCQDQVIQCGDGKVDGSEECEYNGQCQESEHCDNCICVEDEAECENGEIDTGEDCEDEGDCSANENCEECQCVEEEAQCGNGVIESPEECEGNNDCGERQTCVSCQCIDTPSYCGDGYLDTGEECESNADCGELGVCSGGCNCVYPPDIDCGNICAEIEGTVSFGNWHESSGACNAYVYDYYQEYLARECTVTCSYAAFTSVSNIAGTATCCCGMAKEFECTNCPCIVPCSPECPDPETTCAANAPSWYME